MPCPVCQHNQTAVIDRALLADAGPATLSRTYWLPPRAPWEKRRQALETPITQGASENPPATPSGNLKPKKCTIRKTSAKLTRKTRGPIGIIQLNKQDILHKKESQKKRQTLSQKIFRKWENTGKNNPCPRQ
jgi:hypothetical protein